MNKTCLFAPWVLAGALLAGCSRDESATPADSAQAAHPPDAADDVPGVTVDENVRQNLGIELEPLRVANRSSRARGMATVIDSAAFAATVADLEAVRAEAATTQQNERRVAGLYRDDGNASRQSLDAARQQSATSNARLAAAASRARLDWGSRLMRADDAASAKLRAEIASGATTVLRAEFSGSLGDASSLAYQLLPARGGPVDVQFLDRSRATAQFAAGDSVLLGLLSRTGSETAFRPGERLPVVATTAGAAIPLVPAEAAVAYQGRMWCYVARPSSRFDRVELDTHDSGPEGFIAKAALEASDKVVVKGAALLLSLERSASAEAGAGAEE